MTVKRTGKIRWRRVFLIFLVFAAVMALVVTGILKLRTDPQVTLLLGEGGAQWIRFPKPFQLMIHDPGKMSTAFRSRLDIREIPPNAILTFRAMKQAAVYLDGQLILRTPDEPDLWKEARHLDLAPSLVRGAQELRIDVVHLNGNAALLAHCSSLGIFSGERWEASIDGQQWHPAVSVDKIEPFPISRSFARTDQALRSLAPLFLLVYFLAFLWEFHLKERILQGRVTSRPLLPSAIRWLILGAWLVLAINNFLKIPLTMGMDHAGHATYIYYMSQHWRVPLASEGWQMFQPPLFHFLEAIFFRIFLHLFDPEIVVRILKLLPVICGMAQVQISYRALQYAYPGREFPQIIGTILGGLLPMNLYMSQSLGNEPLAGCLTALVILGVCRILSGQSESLQKMTIYMGFTLGLALLTKVTPLLIIPPTLCFVAATLYQQEESNVAGRRSVIRFAFIFLGMALAIAGWYYLRNWTETGRLFIGGWDRFRDIAWWQDPGYRTVRQCIRFGESLFYPVYSSIYGFWDAIYSSLWVDGFLSEIDRPPWNYQFMLSGVWLSLLPSAAIWVGAVASLRLGKEPSRKIRRFCTACMVIYLAAIFYLFITVPILSSAKATYALGLTPCIAILGAAGLEIMARLRFIRATLYGFMACWAVASYAAYLVL